VLVAPAVRVQQKARGRTTGDGRNNRPSLHDGLTAYTRSPRGPAFLPPSVVNPLGSATLMSAPGHQDHTTSPCAAGCSSARDTRAATATPHRIPRPTSVTIAKRPSCGHGTR